MITTEINEQGYHLIDSTTGERRTFTDQREFARASLVEILRHGEEMEKGLERLQASYERPRPVQPLRSPEAAAQALGGHPGDYDRLFRDQSAPIYVCGGQR